MNIMCEAPENHGSLSRDLISTKPLHITKWILLKRAFLQRANVSSLVTDQRSVSNGLFQFLPEGVCFTDCLMMSGPSR